MIVGYEIVFVELWGVFVEPGLETYSNVIDSLY